MTSYTVFGEIGVGWERKDEDLCCQRNLGELTDKC